MNNDSEYPQRETRFEAPNVSHLDERSRELSNQSRIVVDKMTATLRRLYEAIDRSNKFLNKQNRRPTMDSDQK